MRKKHNCACKTREKSLINLRIDVNPKPRCVSKVLFPTEPNKAEPTKAHPSISWAPISTAKTRKTHRLDQNKLSNTSDGTLDETRAATNLQSCFQSCTDVNGCLWGRFSCCTMSFFHYVSDVVKLFIISGTLNQWETNASTSTFPYVWQNLWRTFVNSPAR